MDTISKQNKGTSFPKGLRFIILAVYAILMIAVLVALNIFPVRRIERKMREDARGQMIQASSSLATTLGRADSLSVSHISSAVTVLGLNRADRRILATDVGGKVVYDSVHGGSLVDTVVTYSEVMMALSGKDAFYCLLEGDALNKWAASPIIRGGTVMGAVYIYECDKDSVVILKDAGSGLRIVSVAAFALSVVFLIVVNYVLGKRFSKILVGVREASSGNFSYRIKISGKDELAEIGNEFNDLCQRIQTDEISRRRFVGDASHELKTPLASIKLLSDSIMQTKNIKMETVNEFLSDISGEITRLIRISEELISINKVDAASVENYICDVADTVENAEERLKVNAEIANVEIHTDCQKGCRVYATDDGLYHIVFNLMENAIKYNRAGGKVYVTLRKQNGRVILTVADTGIGIPEHDQRRVFERFFRVDKNRSRATGGSGLGLSIVKEWTEKLGAELSLESKFGEGSVFTVDFPECREE